MTSKYPLTTVDMRILVIMAIEMATASISAAISMLFHMQPNLAMASCVTVKSKQSERVLGESWAVWATKHMTFHGRSF